jgi:hypothetical protein
MKHKMIISLREAIRLRLFAAVIAIVALFGSMSVLPAAEPNSQRPYPNLSDTNQLVQVYDGKPEWISKPLGSVADNKEFIAGGYLCRTRIRGILELVPEVDIARLLDADRPFEKDNWRFPETNDVVRVLDREGRHVSHERLDHVRPGSQFVFQGRRFKFEAGDQPGAVQIVDTGQTLSRVVQTFKRKTDTLLDLTIRNESGNNSVISCTPEHPFYVPAQSAYVAACDLKPDTAFETANQKLATLASVAVRHGDFEVYNLEVEGAHNYYVGKDQVLVHNACSVAQRISLGHAFDKHLSDWTALGIKTRKELGDFVDKIMMTAKGANVKKLPRGRTAYWDDATQTVVIHDPNNVDWGTAFRPDPAKYSPPRSYFEDL